MKLFKSLFAVAAVASLACSCNKGENPWLDSQPIDTPEDPVYDVWPEPVIVEPKANTFTITESPAEGYSNYYIYVYDGEIDPVAESANWIARLQFLNNPGLTMAELCGEYSVQSYASQAGLMADGYYIDLSQWGMSGAMEGGSAFGDDADSRKYIGAGGTVSISSAKNKDGELVYTFSGKNLTLSDTKGGQTTGDLNLEAIELPFYTCAIASVSAASTQEGPVEGLAKYYIHVYAPGVAPDGKSHCCELQVVNNEGMKLEDLVGDYTAASYPGQPFLMDNGYVFAAWNFAGGSFCSDEDGNKLYIDAGGVVSIKKVEAGGKTYFTISAKDINVTPFAGDPGQASFEYKYAVAGEIPAA